MRIVLALILVFLPSAAFAAVGDTVASCSSVSSAATLDIQPGAGVEWLIHNIWFEATSVTVQRYDGSNTAGTMTLTGPDWEPVNTRVTNSNRIRVLNNDASAKVICYDGVIVK